MSQAQPDNWLLLSNWPWPVVSLAGFTGTVGSTCVTALDHIQLQNYWLLAVCPSLPERVYGKPLFMMTRSWRPVTHLYSCFGFERNVHVAKHEPGLFSHCRVGCLSLCLPQHLFLPWSPVLLACRCEPPLSSAKKSVACIDRLTVDETTGPEKDLCCFMACCIETINGLLRSSWT